LFSTDVTVLVTRAIGVTWTSSKGISRPSTFRKSEKSVADSVLVLRSPATGDPTRRRRPFSLSK